MSFLDLFHRFQTTIVETAPYIRTTAKIIVVLVLTLIFICFVYSIIMGVNKAFKKTTEDMNNKLPQDKDKP